jgi:hypothetical protein
LLSPDANSYAKWHNKAIELNLRVPTATFFPDNTLELMATDIQRKQSIDIADIWLDEVEG